MIRDVRSTAFPLQKPRTTEAPIWSPEVSHILQVANPRWRPQEQPAVVIMLQQVIMHFSLHYLSGGRLREVENKGKQEKLIFNEVTRNLRRNRNVTIITKRHAR